MLISRQYCFVGEGRRHLVLSNENIVVRVQKKMESNTVEHVKKTLLFHDRFLMKWFRGFICGQYKQIVSSDDVFADIVPRVELSVLSTANLMCRNTIEVKPKCALVEREGLPPRFVAEQSAGGADYVFDPTPIWSGCDKAGILESLSTGRSHPKKYVRIHSWKDMSGQDPLELLVNALMSDKGRQVLVQLERLQKVATDEFAKLIANLPIDYTKDPESIDFYGPSEFPTPETFRELVVNASSSWDLDRVVNAFLAGRMAMDVSLMISFFSADEIPVPSELCVFPVADGIWCTIGIVDTDLKHRQKISFYANQFDLALALFPPACS